MNKNYYTWPNPAFPFRILLEKADLRIFIIENIQHNYKWISKYSSSFQDRDFFFIYCGWYHSEFFAKQVNDIFDELLLKKSQFFILFNSVQEKQNFSNTGIDGDIINQNCWLDWDFVKPVNADTQFDAVYVARHSPFKRHELASKVPNLALIMGNSHQNEAESNLPNFVFRNDSPLLPKDVFGIVCKSKCGLILSEIEGACFSSSEYLLLGRPVVSTRSFGGRDYWYNENNSIIVEDNEDSVAEGVKKANERIWDSKLIREEHILKSKLNREKFIVKLSELFESRNVDLDPQCFFNDIYYHKMRKSLTPNFDEIWPL